VTRPWARAGRSPKYDSPRPPLQTPRHVWQSGKGAANFFPAVPDISRRARYLQRLNAVCCNRGRTNLGRPTGVIGRVRETSTPWAATCGRSRPEHRRTESNASATGTAGPCHRVASRLPAPYGMQALQEVRRRRRRCAFSHNAFRKPNRRERLNSLFVKQLCRQLTDALNSAYLVQTEGTEQSDRMPASRPRCHPSRVRRHPGQGDLRWDVAQFTPKTVETAEERQKLTFRIKTIPTRSCSRSTSAMSRLG
jgi:hypothetical protein